MDTSPCCYSGCAARLYRNQIVASLWSKTSSTSHSHPSPIFPLTHMIKPIAFHQAINGCVILLVPIGQETSVMPVRLLSNRISHPTTAPSHLFSQYLFSLLIHCSLIKVAHLLIWASFRLCQCPYFLKTKVLH